MRTAPLIYVAGPYSSGDPVQNTNTATEFGLSLFENYRVGVIVPHLTLLAHAMFPRKEQFWYDWDFLQLDHCDAMIRLPGESRGADAEEQRAKERKIPVFHWNSNEDQVAFVTLVDLWDWENGKASEAAPAAS